jgi:calcineurin-like phosphoesterase family protein
MIRFWTADPHFNHANIAAYTNRPQMQAGDYVDGKWKSQETAYQRAKEMNTFLIKKANARVKPEDTVVCVGDFSCKGGDRGVQALRRTPSDILSELNGNWVLVEGNHDKNNGVKPVCNFMACQIGIYSAGIIHVPLPEITPASSNKPEWMQRKEELTEYCRKAFHFMICGHVHNSWHTKFIAGIWHINVGVDANRYMPITDVEVIRIYEQLYKIGNQK